MTEPLFRANDGTRFDYLSDGSVRICRDRLGPPMDEQAVHILAILEAGEWPHLVQALERAQVLSSGGSPE